VTAADLLVLADSHESGDCPENVLLDAVEDVTGVRWEWRPCRLGYTGELHDLVRSECPKGATNQHDYAAAWAGSGQWNWFPSEGWSINTCDNPRMAATVAFARRLAAEVPM
jgi:hypothetical protein